MDKQQDSQDDVGGEEDDSQDWAATITADRQPWVLNVGVTVWGRGQHGAQQIPPPCYRGHGDQTRHAVAKRLKIKPVVDQSAFLHVGKAHHAKGGEGEDEEEEEEADVEEGRK